MTVAGVTVMPTGQEIRRLRKIYRVSLEELSQVLRARLGTPVTKAMLMGLEKLDPDVVAETIRDVHARRAD